MTMDTVFLGATLIDGTGGAPVPDAAVVVSDGRVSWTGPAYELDASTPRHRIDAGGKYLVPGLLDANAHLVMHMDPEILLRYDPGAYDELVVEAAQIALRAGITTVFDTCGPAQALRRVRDRVNAGEVTGSRVYFAGNIIGNGGPWSEDFGETGKALNPSVVERVNWHWEQGVGSDLTWMPSTDVRTAVREYIATRGIDFVKYASSAHRSFRLIAMSPDSQHAIVEEAHAAGMTAQACTLAPEALKLAIEAGVDLLQHGGSTGKFPMPQETLDLIAGRQLPCVVTLFTERRIAASKEDPNFPELWRNSFITRNENARRLVEAGAKLMLATDGGIFSPDGQRSPWVGALVRPPDPQVVLGESHVYWIQAALECGMTPMDALLSTTRNIAQAYRRDDEIGTVEPGKRADLLVLDADPLADPENYRRIAHVVKDGEIVDRDRLPERPVLTGESGA
jgi:imidazolonepropionase-like amidohydrolase